jgi:hypothetical protein
MPSLAQTYSQALGMKLDKMYSNKHFYPLHFDKYVTIQPFSSNQASKNYDYWNEVTVILAPALEAHGYKIVQIGGKDEPALAGCVHLMGQTTLAQSNYILSNSSLHVGADSYCQHVAGSLNIPLLVIFGSTSPENHGSHWKDKHIFIESHRFGNNTSFGYEQDKTINVIKVEEVVNAAFKLLELPINLNRQSFYVGHKYPPMMIEYVPDAPLSPEFAKGAPVIARLDYGYDEQCLAQTLSARKLYLIANKCVNPNLIAQFKGHIDGITFEFTKESDFTPEYIKQVKSIGVKTQFITTEIDGEELSKLRLDYFDYCQIFKFTHKNKGDFIGDVKKYLNTNEFPLITTPPLFKSNKFILARGKAYLSKYHYLKDSPAESFAHNVAPLVDDPEFWKEQDYFYVFSQKV